MTAQIKEKLILNGEIYGMATEPLYAWLNRRSNKHIRFKRRHTACRRGYTGTWEITDDCLYLVKISGQFLDGSEATLKDLFPDNPIAVIASWFDGELRCPVGDLLEYVHSGYSSIYERDLFLIFKQGKLISERNLVNQAPPLDEKLEKKSPADSLK